MNPAYNTVESAIEFELRHNEFGQPSRLVVGDRAPAEWRADQPAGCIKCFTSKWGFVIPMVRGRSSKLEWRDGHVTIFTTI